MELDSAFVPTMDMLPDWVCETFHRLGGTEVFDLSD